jgi:hypothetical protein
MSSPNGAQTVRSIQPAKPLTEQTGLDSEDLTEITQTKLIVDERRNQIEHDAGIYRIAVVCLGGTTLFTVISLAVLSAMQVDVHDGLIALGSGAVGALAGLLTPISVRR